MNYKNTLLFISKCLTINHESKNKKEIEHQLLNTDINWDLVVKVSTTHYVFPALYCNLKRANLLNYVPSELVNYMIHISDLNRNRNQQIITQAHEINNILLKHKITPIFLKGTANLHEGLYNDITERMVGDIDFLVEDKHYKTTIKILKKHGYSEHNPIHKNNPIEHRHYPKMVKRGKIASIEVHKAMVSHEKFNEFDYEFVSKSFRKINNFHLLSAQNSLVLTCINKQLNDRGYQFKSIALRNAYDLFLQSKKTDSLQAIKQLNHADVLNNFLYSSYLLFNKPKSITYQNSENANKFVEKQWYWLENPEKYGRFKKITQFKILLKHRAGIIIKSLYNKKFRNYTISKIKSMFLTR